MTVETGAPLAPKPNTFSRIAGVLFTPAATFGDIARRPNIWGPLLLILAISYVTTFITAPLMDWNAVTEMQVETMKKQNPDLTDDDVARVGKFTTAMGKAMRFIGPILSVILILLIAGVLLLGVRLFGGDGNFAQAFSATLYAWIPMVILGIVATIVGALAGTINPVTMQTLVKSNPGFLVDMQEQPVLFTLLASLDVFTIWTLVLLVFGFSALSNLSRGKTAAIIITIWVFVLACRLGLAAIGSGMSS